MKFIRHRSSLFKLPANMAAIVGYLFLSLGVGIPIINQFTVLICLVVFVVEKKSYLVQFHTLQSAFVAMLAELFRSLGVLGISWGWNWFHWQDSTVQMLLYGVIYGLVLVQAVAAITGVLAATRWKTLCIPVAGQLTNWLLNRWKTGVNKEEYLSTVGNDGVGLKRKRK